MKRALIVLLLLAVVAGGLFAQLTISGHVQSGIEAVIPSEGDPTVAWWNWDTGIPAEPVQCRVTVIGNHNLQT